MLPPPPPISSALVGLVVAISGLTTALTFPDPSTTDTVRYTTFTEPGCPDHGVISFPLVAQASCAQIADGLDTINSMTAEASFANQTAIRVCTVTFFTDPACRNPTAYQLLDSEQPGNCLPVPGFSHRTFVTTACDQQLPTDNPVNLDGDPAFPTAK